MWGSRFLWKQEKTYSVDYIHHHFCLCISIEFTSLNLLSNSKKCKNFATHSDEAISTKLDFETWHGDMHVEGELPGANYKWLKRLPYHATKDWHWSFINYNALILLFTIHFSHVRLTLLSFNLTLIWFYYYDDFILLFISFSLFSCDCTFFLLFTTRFIIPYSNILELVANKITL